MDIISSSIFNISSGVLIVLLLELYNPMYSLEEVLIVLY